MGTLLIFCAWIGGNVLWECWKRQKEQAARRARPVRNDVRTRVRPVRVAEERQTARRSA